MADFLKALFGDNEALTYDQLMEKVNAAGIRLSNLADGKYLSLDKHNEKVHALNGQIATLQEQLSQRDTDLDGIKTQLTAAQADASKLPDVQKQLSDLQTKYDTETQSFQKKLTEQKHEFSVREKAATLKFSSTAASKEFMRDALGTSFTYDKDGNLLGWDDYVSGYKERDPGAFFTEPAKEPEKESDDTPVPPSIVAPSASGKKPGAGDSKDAFGFHFVGVRPRPETD